MSEEPTRTREEALLDIGAAMSGISLIDNRPTMIMPNGWHLQDLEPMLPRPLRHQQTTLVHDLPSFVALYKRFERAESVVVAEVTNARFTAIFDFAAADRPSWGSHRLVFTPTPSLDWQAWVKQNGKRMQQVEFAEFIESNLTCILRPAPAAMLEVAQHLVAHREIKFESGVRLHDGQTQLRYDETLRGQVRAGTVEVPERFVLGISPFFNGQPFELEAFLRYRIQDKNLVMWYDLHRHQEFFQKALLQIAAEIEAATGRPVLHGQP